MRLAKIAGYRWYEIKMSCFECDKTSSPWWWKTVGKLSSCNTGYFVKMTLSLKKPTDYLCSIKRFITVLYGRTSKHLYEI